MEFNSTNMLRIADVCRRTGLSKSQVHRLVGELGFPRPVKLSKRATAWVEGEVENWLQRRIAESRKVA